jgi:hypothetical protein
MIIYGENKRKVRPADVLQTLSTIPARDALIEFGELEAAMADLLCSDCDAPHPLLDRMRAVSVSLAHCLRGTPGIYETVDSSELPPQVTVSTAEGYAWYALYPETYCEAAAQFLREVRPSSAVVIGIRGIGTSLSAVVVATLEDGGCPVRSFTVRPRGHPFDRRLHLSAEMVAAWAQCSSAHFLIVDEGPGLSGSSFISVVRALTELGVPEQRIILFPSWPGDAETLLSSEARLRWNRHPQYTSEPAPPPDARELSAGKWRDLFYADENFSPAVQPQHERRKYLQGDLLLKFAGLGPYSRGKLRRAQSLWEAGFGPRPLRLDDGYLVTQFIEGRPLTPESCPPTVLYRLADYLAFRASTFVSEGDVPFDRNMEMIRTNVREGLGEAWVSRVEDLEELRSSVAAAKVVEVDGRMLPFEWIETGGGSLKKVDAVDHYNDHFFPGCQDIAWDLAGAVVEFSLAPDQQSTLLQYYLSRTKDGDLLSRLPFYLIAYLSYRMAYCHVSAAATARLPDSCKFRRMEGRYQQFLKIQLEGRNLVNHAR